MPSLSDNTCLKVVAWPWPWSMLPVISTTPPAGIEAHLGVLESRPPVAATVVATPMPSSLPRRSRRLGVGAAKPS